MEKAFLTSKSVESRLKSLIESYKEDSEYRMKNYYDCVDDYSWGGVCDQAQKDVIRGLETVLALLLEQEANGGYIYKTITELELQTLNGEFVSNKIVAGRYGSCFMWGNDEFGVKFCGLSKKQSTFAKKGFVVVTKHYNLKIKYTGTVTKGGYADCIVELVDLNTTINQEVDTMAKNNNYALYKLKTK